MKNQIWIVPILALLIFSACQQQERTVVKDQPRKSHDQLMAELFPQPKIKVKTVGILLYDGYTTLDAMGPYQVLGEMMGTKVFFVGRHKGPIANYAGMKVLTDTSIAEVDQLDVLVIPGGLRDTYNATRDMALINWIKKIDSNSVYTASVCTGAWILGATGLLDKKKATTHWYGKDILRNQFGAELQDQRFARDGKYWTSAGVTAGMDMSLAMVAEIMGEKYARTVMLDLEYDPKPPFDGGSEHNTDREIVDGMRAMYDAGMETALHPEKAFRNLKLANKRDYICHMPTAAGIVDTAMVGEKVYGFCSKECKAEFVKNPAGYIAMEK